MLDLDDFAEAVEYLISIFHIPLETKGMCVASIQDEMLYPMQGIGSENYHKIWYTSPTFSCSVNFCTAYPSLPAVLSDFSHC